MNNSNTDSLGAYSYNPDANVPQPKKKKSKIWLILLSIISVVLILILLGFVGLGLIFSSMFDSTPTEVNDNSVLYLNLDYGISEYTKGNALSIFKDDKEASFLEIISAIRSAKTDDRIKGIYIKAEGSSLGFAKLVEINEAVEEFKASGKFVYAYLETGEEKDYMLTLPAQKIFMPYEAIVMIDGFGTAQMFFKSFMEKYGVNFTVVGFEDFKSAAELYSRDGFSDSSRMQMKVYTEQMKEGFLDAIQKYRKIDKQKANALIDEGIYTTDVMKAAGFIDEITVETRIKEEMTKLVYGKKYNKESKLNLVSIEDYIYSKPYGDDDKYSKKGDIGIVYASGAIYPGNRGNDLFSTDQSVFSNQFVRNLRKAVKDDDIKVIIVRIDSPGGSVLGSEIIWQEIMEAKKKKPVLASMSDVAASGGYYIATACDTIIAHPLTITGSIGVISAIPNFSGAISKLGISIDTVQTNKNTHFFNPMLNVPQYQKDKFVNLSRTIYYRFLNKVAESRKMTVEQARSYAKGRVWTGKDAKDRKLVDVLGGLTETIKIAKQKIGINVNTPVRIKVFPKNVDNLSGLLGMLKKSDNLEDEELSLNQYLNAMSMKMGQEYGYFKAIYQAMPKEMQKQLIHLLNVIKMSETERTLMILPQAYGIN